MALSGTLQELGVVDLIQLPHHAGRKTGLLELKSEQGVAFLYYVGGHLVHAVVGDELGLDALVEIIDWTRGEFEFRLDARCDAKTIEVDLHRVIMMALKTRDERKLQQQQSPPAQGTVLGMSVQALSSKVDRFMNSNEFVSSVVVVSTDGTSTLVKRRRDDDPIEETVTSLVARLSEDYPRGGLRRVILEDQEGTLLLMRLDQQIWLGVTANVGTSLGAVSITTQKLYAELTAS